jgi:hypothetical protein
VVGGYRLERVLGAVRELNVFTAQGPSVLVQVGRCATGADCKAPLAARILDLQIPLVDKFSPAATDQFAALPRDPSGPVGRTLPLPADRATSTSGAAYEITGALRLATACRYTIKVVARQLDTANQQMAAQYRVLTGWQRIDIRTRLSATVAAESR